MLITLKTFNGNTLNSSSFQTVLMNPHGSSTADTIFVDQSEADPQDAGTYAVNKQTKTLSINILNYANRNALIAQLKVWFKRGARGYLVGTFNDEGVDYQLDCRVVSLTQDADHPMHWTALLETGNSAWRSVDAVVEDEWVVTGTSETKDITVGGYDETYLSMTLTTGATPDLGYLKQKLYRLPNPVGIERGLIAWCIELDTAALVTAGHMQADCNDLAIVDLNTGLELKRWIDDPNTTTTKVWFNLDLKKGFSLTLGTLVASSGTPAYLQFAVNANNKAAITAMEKKGIVYHGNEWFAYTSTDPVNCRLTLGAREIFGTTKESHAAGSTFQYIQYPLLMKYSNSTAVDPASLDANYDDTKPMINLHDSDNNDWYWDDTIGFYDPDHPNRTCAWKASVSTIGGNSKAYYISEDEETGDPAMGLWAQNYFNRIDPTGIYYIPDTFVLSFTFFDAAGFTDVPTFSGQKYVNSLDVGWPATAALRRSANGTTYYNLWAEAAPGTADTWTSITHNTVSVAAGSKYLQLTLAGKTTTNRDIASYALEALTLSATFATSGVPTGTFIGSENESFNLDLTIANNTDEYDDAITLNFAMLEDKSLVIDGERRTVLYDGSNAYGALTTNDESRSAFIRLKGGVTNTIGVSGPDLGELSIFMSYYRRRL